MFFHSEQYLRTLCTFFLQLITTTTTTKAIIWFNALIWSEKLITVFLVLYSTTIFSLRQIYIFIFIISLEFFIKKNQNIFYLSIPKLIILLLFSLSITFPRFNLIIIISFKFHLRSKYTNQIYIFLY